METKKNPFSTQKTIRCRGELVDFTQPKVMGIVNTTPNSFYSGSRYQDEKTVLNQVEKFISEGADFIDIGGYSTRPGAVDVPEDEEINRTIPYIRSILKQFPGTIISIDTFRSSIAQKALDEGAMIINDISGGDFDKEMYATVAHNQVPYILMHIQGTPKTMQENPGYEDVTKDIIRELSGKVEQLHSMGVNDIIIDPGFGFGKTVNHNFQLLRQLKVFEIFEMPILAGLSRKSMINKVLNIKPEEALNGTSVLNTLALMNGANILRVHDVKEAKETIHLFEKYMEIPLDKPAEAY